MAGAPENQKVLSQKNPPYHLKRANSVNRLAAFLAFEQQYSETI